MFVFFFFFLSVTVCVQQILWLFLLSKRPLIYFMQWIAEKLFIVTGLLSNLILIIYICDLNSFDYAEVAFFFSLTE